MIKNIIIGEKYNDNFIFTDFFKNQILNIVLMIHHTHTGIFYQNLNNSILSSLLNLRLEEMDDEKLEHTLKEFFITLNWQINTKLKKYVSKNEGISLLLMIIKNDIIYMVQFGRILAAISEKGKFKNFGCSWEYFKVKNKKELNLLGFEDKNINVKIYKKKIEDNQKILLISSENADKIDFNKLNTSKIALYLDYLYKNNKFLYLVFDIYAHKEIKKQKAGLRKRLKITLLVIIILLLLSTGYVYFGKNWLQTKQEELKEKNKEFIRNDIFQTILEKQNQLQEAVDQIFNGKIEIKLFANNKLKLKKSWEMDLKFKITQKPLFDIKNIYLFSYNNLYALNKITKKIAWKTHFKTTIKYAELIDANRMLISTADTLYCIKRKDAKILWKTSQNYSTITATKIPNLFFAINEYNKLNSGVILTVKNDSIKLISNISGEEIASFKFNNKINYISKYDKIFRCLYIISGDKLIKLNIYLEL